MIFPQFSSGFPSSVSADSKTTTSVGAISENSKSLKNPRFQKVIYIVFENTERSTTLKNPYFKKIASEGALLENMTAEFRPSQPNYIAMIAGDSLNVRKNDNIDLSETQITDLLEKKERTWRVYAESYPGSCYLNDIYKTYVRKHNPFISFISITKNKKKCSNIQNMNQFFKDINNNQLSHFSFIVPDLDHSGHDTNVFFAANWFKKYFDSYLHKKSLLNNFLWIITFDESEVADVQNQIYTVLLGAGIQPGSKSSAHLNHYSLLHLIEKEWNLGTLGRKDQSAPLPEDSLWMVP